MIKSSLSGAQEARAALKKEMARIADGDNFVLVGFPEGSGSYETGEAIAGVAAANEFGTKTIPARPFLQSGVEAGSAEYIAIIEESAQAVTDGAMDMHQVLEQIGLVATAKVKEFMINLTSPANAESTVKRKKSSNPLVDTSAMIQAVTHVTTNEKPQEGI